jgi:hypothetical protein
MKQSTITYYIERGWDQSYSVTASGCIFRKQDDATLTVIVVNPNGLVLSESRFDEFACKSGAAHAAITAMYRHLCKAA